MRPPDAAGKKILCQSASIAAQSDRYRSKRPKVFSSRPCELGDREHGTEPRNASGAPCAPSAAAQSLDNGKNQRLSAQDARGSSQGQPKANEAASRSWSAIRLGARSPGSTPADPSVLALSWRSPESGAQRRPAQMLAARPFLGPVDDIRVMSVAGWRCNGVASARSGPGLHGAS